MTVVMTLFEFSFIIKRPCFSSIGTNGTQKHAINCRNVFIMVKTLCETPKKKRSRKIPGKSEGRENWESFIRFRNLDIDTRVGFCPRVANVEVSFNASNV